MATPTKAMIKGAVVGTILVVMFGFLCPFLVSSQSDLGVATGVVIVLATLTYGLVRAIKFLAE